MGLFDGFSTSNRQEIRPLVTWKLVTTIFIFSGLFSKFIHTNAVENPDGDNGQQTAPHHLHHVTHIGVSGGGELGDLAISDTSRDGLFASMDNDGNGKVTLEELTQVSLCFLHSILMSQ